MKLYWIKTNALIKRMYSKYIWDIPNRDKKVYLTFDDGPTPEITKWTLLQLRKYNIKATFFCIGNNIEKYPEIFNTIIQEGHALGNHTFNHLNGWNTSTEVYLEDIKKCSDALSYQPTAADCKLFRPPYGKITTHQSKKLTQMGYKIIMWDVLSADFDQTITPEKCLENVISNVTSGSIIVFHDSVKSFENLAFTLPKTLEFLKEKGYRCDTIC
ncbi:polysaccharide deacetylase family protein [Flavobacterium psychrotolerans]|uniref:Polysaccharide deacetylase family protein n=1 Tax=Flavobacterium psychrotolerans TaxID=2169410 RepID=A0A2U1JNT7_9FLAO|nr:polysaccharide deacetylase family protein [Flavobacterium psychrotolerans]PWA06837.1 polysaccharide deacetylase family protein [Flavobacterium psychrotolerans]